MLLRRLPRWLLLVACLALAGVHLLSAWRRPVGSYADDALQVILARSLRHGAFAFPDTGGIPVTDPLPGFASLLMVPAWIVEPEWSLLQTLSLLCSAAAAFLAWRLARRLFSGGLAVLAAFLVALTPAFVDHAGAVLPDIPFLALSTALFDALAGQDTRAARGLLYVGAALACLLRPHGALLALSLGAAVWHRSGLRRGLALWACAFLPLAAWSLRCRLLTESFSGYAPHWSDSVRGLWEPGRQAAHAAEVAAVFFGQGVLGLSDAPFSAQAAAGLAWLGFAAYGAARLLRKRQEPWLFSMAAFGMLALALHLTYLQVAVRHALPFIALGWLFVMAAAEPLFERRRLAAAGTAVIAALMLRADLASAYPGLQGRTPVLAPQMVAWIRENTPPSARFQSLMQFPLTLLTDRTAFAPHPEALYRDAWLASLIADGVEYVHVEASPLYAGSFAPPGTRTLLANLGRWARSSPYLVEAYRDTEGTAVFRVEHPHPDRFGKAWRAYDAANIAMVRGGRLDFVIAQLREAVRLEPQLAFGWAALGRFEKDPRTKLRYFELAGKADPTSPYIQEDLAKAREAAPAD